MLLGVDLSNYNAQRGPVDFVALKAAGCGFAFLKATEGVDFQDYSVGMFAQGCVDAELPFAYYHLATPGGARKSGGGYKTWWDPKDEAHDFLTVVETLPEAPCFPIIDFEWAGMDECLPNFDDRARWCREWIDIVSEHQRQRVPWFNGELVQFYSNPDWLGSVTLPDPVINACPLWYARWTSPPPPFDTSWGWDNWTIWQYDDKGTIDGVTGRVDMNTAPSLDPVTFAALPRDEKYSRRIRRSVRKIRRQCDELALVAADLEREGL